MSKTSSNEHKQESKTEPWIILTYTISTAKFLTNGFQLANATKQPNKSTTKA